MPSGAAGGRTLRVIGLLTMVLASVGLYSVISSNVAQCTRELGVRRALGAQVGDVVVLVLRQGVLLGGAGIALGVVVTCAAARQVALLLFDVTARDPLVYAGVSAVMLVVALAASFIPARRDGACGPTVALRSE